MTERETRADHEKREWRAHTRRDEHRRQGRNNSDSEEIHESTEEDWVKNDI